MIKGNKDWQLEKWKVMEQLEPSYIACWNEISATTCRKQFLKRFDMYVPNDPAIPLLGIYPKHMKIHTKKSHQCSLQHYSEYPKPENDICPSADEGIPKCSIAT